MIEPIEYALLIGEMEGVYAKLKNLGTPEELKFIDNMKKKYYKLYFKQLKAEREQILD